MQSYTPLEPPPPPLATSAPGPVTAQLSHEPREPKVAKIANPKCKRGKQKAKELKTKHTKNREREVEVCGV